MIRLLYKNNFYLIFQVRVDGISPTCYQKPNCREYGSFASVISVE